MQTRWLERNADLKKLYEKIEYFFRRRNFAVKKEISNNSYHLFAMLEKEELKRTIIVTVTITGQPNDFTVDFMCPSLSERRKRLLRLFSPFLLMIGGGIFILQDFKIMDFLEKLEDEFWFFMDKAVDEVSSPPK